MAAFFAFFLGVGLGCGGDAHTRLNASSKGIGSRSRSDFSLMPNDDTPKMPENTLGSLLDNPKAQDMLREHVYIMGAVVMAHADVEAGLHYVARKLSGLSEDKARIIFGGMRNGDIIERINKMMVHDGTDSDVAKDISDCLSQFSIVSTERDKLVHRTVEFVEERGLVVQNWATAKSLLHAEIQTFELYALANMLGDLASISARLMLFTSPELKAKSTAGHLAEIYSPWRYTPVQQQKKKGDSRKGKADLKRGHRLPSSPE